MTTNMITSNPDTLWATHGSEECEEADEPPELRFKREPDSNKFQKTAIRRPSVSSSLLTQAIMGHSDDDFIPRAHEVTHTTLSNTQRRRSLASNISFASTADLTSDTGLTSPSRPNTPSPPLPEMAMLRLDGNTPTDPKHVSLLGAAVRLQGQLQPAHDVPRKRCIQFACGGKPPVPEANLRAQPMVKTPSAQEAPRRPCIKFACPARPASTQNTPPHRIASHMNQAASNAKLEPPSTPKTSVFSTASSDTPRQSGPRRPSCSRPRYLRANSKDLTNDGSHFHEFASDIAREEDWIRHESPVARKKLTINDTLTKENHIRRLATEAEEEAEEEEEINNEEDDEDAVDDDDEDEDDLDAALDDEDDEDEEEEDDEDEEDDDSDGYHTDEETGFADSDEDDEDDDLVLWTPGQMVTIPIGSSAPTARRLSIHEQSDSSITTQNSHPNTRRERARRMKRREEAPDLPDSTDFVCGTLDEDRPLEEAYMSCLAARRNGKLRTIPQDIDPSFPASDPEDEDEGEIFNPVHHDSDDDEEWLHGKMEDIHHELDRPRRRRKSNVSPKRFRSPPPKRHHSPPPPRNRGRSPKPLFDHPSLRKGTSPGRALRPMTTPLGSPRCGQIKYNLAGRPGLTYTKSLPRAGAMFFLKHGRHQKPTQDQDIHLRGAIDIVKGLESKRQRRKEKFFQKYCNRARRGQIPERRPQPGRGAERMRELGLLMAGKKDQGNYVLSV